MKIQAPIDFVIVTALEEERDAVLQRLPGSLRLPPSRADIRVYFAGELPATFPDGSTCTYSVVVMPLLSMGQTDAATATSDAIRRWRPRYVLLVGIVGGISERGVRLGDVLVSDQIVDYELQKLTPEGPEVRYRVHQADARLLGAARNYRSNRWLKLVNAKRPRKGSPQRLIGPIATGNKVVAVKDVLRKYADEWPKLIGVEMEAGGVASACFQAEERPGFFMVRAVSDLADEQKDSAAVQEWRQYACEIAASYAISLIKNGPVPASRSHTAVFAPNMAPPDLQYYTGRIRELQELEEKLLSLRRSPIIICGVGGVGKSALVKHFAAMCRQHFPDGIFWGNVDRETPIELATSIAIQLGETLPPFSNEAQARALIRRLLDNRRALLVLDNADHHDAAKRVKNMLPSQGSSVLVLVTTRDTSLPGRLGFSEDKGLELQSFSAEEAIQHFRTVLGNDFRLDEEFSELARILELVGRLPLLTDILARTFSRRKVESFAGLRERLERPGQIANLTVENADAEGQTVARLIVDKTLELLQEPSLTSVLTALGACAETGFSIETAMAVAQANDELVMRNTLLKLVGCSLLQEVQAGERFALHPVVKACVRSMKGIERADMEHARRWNRYVKRYRVNIFEKWDSIFEHQEFLANEWVGIRIAWDWVLEHVSDEMSPHTEECCWTAAEIGVSLRYFLDGLGHWRDALPRLHASIEAAKRIENNEYEFRLRRHYAIILRKSHNLKEALRANEENIALTIRMKRLGYEGMEREQLGRVLLRLGRYDEAETQLVRAHEIASSPAGLQRYVPATLNCLGELKLRCGDYQKAEEFFKKALTHYRKAQSMMGICGTFAHLGNVQYERAEWKAAAYYYAQSIQPLESVVAWMDDEGARVLRLGVLLEKLDQPVKAFACYVIATDICQQLGISGWWEKSAEEERDRLHRQLEHLDRYPVGAIEAEGLIVWARAQVQACVQRITGG
jgi:nucleoside phosphorylase/tetratricopeptide (TPR) repeat protein